MTYQPQVNLKHISQLLLIIDNNALMMFNDVEHNLSK